MFKGGEDEALNHLQTYLKSGALSTYKNTRNELMGDNFSSKLSAWLAQGSLSVKTVYSAVEKCVD